MLTKNVNTITDVLLSKEIAKYKNAVAFQRFLQNQSENSKQNFEKIIENNEYSSNINEPILKTELEDDDSIVSREYATVPFYHMQSETITQKDGTRIHTIFYPSCEEIPAKRVVYSPESMVTKTTLFDTSGNIKSEHRIIKFPDGSGSEEKIDTTYGRKTKKIFNKNNIATKVESYVNGKLAFSLECDEHGNIKRECNYQNIKGDSILSKEIIHHQDICYTVKEYTATGALYSSYTKSTKNEKNTRKIINF